MTRLNTNNSLAGLSEAIDERLRDLERGSEYPKGNNNIRQPTFYLDRSRVVIAATRAQLGILRSADLEQLEVLSREACTIAEPLSKAIRRLEEEQTEITNLLQLLGRIERLEVLLDKISTHRKLMGTTGGSIDQICGFFQELSQYPLSVFKAASLRRVVVVGRLGAEEEYAEQKAWIVGLLLEESTLKASPKHTLALLESIGIEAGSGEEAQMAEALKGLFRTTELSLLQPTVGGSMGGELGFAMRIARIIDHTNLFISRQCPSSNHPSIIAPVLEEADVAVGGLICEYRSGLGGSTSGYYLSKSGAGAGGDQSSGVLRRLDLDLTEYALICRHGLQFIGYANGLLDNDRDDDNDNNDGRDGSCRQILPSTRLQRENLLKEYPNLELRYLNLGITKAREIDAETTDSGFPQSTSVDDTFFLVKKAIFRAISMVNVTGETAMPKALLSGISQILEETFVAGILQKQQSLGILDKPETKQAYVRCTNDLTASTIFLDKLIAHLRVSFGEEEEEEGEEVASNLQRLYNLILAHLQLIKTRVSLLLPAIMGTVQYDLENGSEEIGQIAEKFVRGYPGLLASLNGDGAATTTTTTTAMVCPTVSGYLDWLVARDLAAYWEDQVLMRGKPLSAAGGVTEMSALQLDRAVRQVLAFLSDRNAENPPLTPVTADAWLESADDPGKDRFRTVFARLLEICEILLTGGDPATVTQVLTDHEVERLLSLRRIST